VAKPQKYRQLTYCKVDNKARKLPSFPADHLLISKSSASPILWNSESTKKTNGVSATKEGVVKGGQMHCESVNMWTKKHQQDYEEKKIDKSSTMKTVECWHQLIRRIKCYLYWQHSTYISLCLLPLNLHISFILLSQSFCLEIIVLRKR